MTFVHAFSSLLDLTAWLIGVFLVAVSLASGRPALGLRLDAAPIRPRLHPAPTATYA
jgi:hypothetical protein